MELRAKNTKLLTIIGLTAVISIIHYGTAGDQMGLHILHRELYFIPIILAGFWFGLQIGLTTSLIITLIYAPHVFIYDDVHSNAVTVFSQVFMYLRGALFRCFFFRGGVSVNGPPSSAWTPPREMMLPCFCMTVAYSCTSQSLRLWWKPNRLSSRLKKASAGKGT